MINATGILGNGYMPFKANNDEFGIINLSNQFLPFKKGRPASTFEGKATDKDSDQ
ncbi:MAG: hypothetical protein NZ729_03120 [Methylococcales bacterium]|nr:hypothetical protein [Methylococcales bacterium]